VQVDLLTPDAYVAVALDRVCEWPVSGKTVSRFDARRQEDVTRMHNFPSFGVDF